MASKIELNLAHLTSYTSCDLYNIRILVIATLKTSLHNKKALLKQTYILPVCFRLR